MGPYFLLLAGALLAMNAAGAEFAMPGGPVPGNMAEVEQRLSGDAPELELLLSFGTSKGGSAGHVAVALPDESGEARVYSANFYADRNARHERDFYTRDLIVVVPKQEYLYGTVSSLGDKASFGLDFGEVYKRSVVGIRVAGVPPAERAAIAAYLEGMNRDFRDRARDTQYQRGEVKYGYTDLNCAKTIGSAFKYGAGYEGVEIRTAPFFSWRKAKAALNANTPSEIAMQLMRELDARGHAMYAVLYRKFPGSPYVDPHDDDAVAFSRLPNRFPSAISLDFRNDDAAYEDFDNLYAMYLMRNLLRFTVTVDGVAQRLDVSGPNAAMSYADAARVAAVDAEADSKGFLRRIFFRPRGTKIGDAPPGDGASAAPSITPPEPAPTPP